MPRQTIPTLTIHIETAPPSDIETMGLMGWELLGIYEVEGIDTAFFTTSIEGTVLNERLN